MFTRQHLTLSVLAAAALAFTAPSAGSAAATPVRSQVGVDHGTWVDVGPMPHRREFQTMVRLHDGRVLVMAGGNTADCCCKHVVDLYDPATDTWLPADPLPRERCSAAVVVMRNGLVLVAGGSAMVKETGLIRDRRTVEVFHPKTRTWTFTTPMHDKRAGAIAALLPHGEVLVAGGGTYKGGRRSAEIYNPRTKTWRMTDRMTYPHTTSVRLPNGDLLVSGDPDYPGSRPCTPERFVVRRHVWRPAGRYAGRCATPLLPRLPNGDVLAIDNHRVHRYDPARNHWRLVDPVPRRDLTTWDVVSVGGLPMVLATDVTCHPAQAVGLGFLWRPGRHEWVRWTTMPVPADGFATQLLGDGSTLVAGGVSRYYACVGGDHIPTRYAYRYLPQG